MKLLIVDLAVLRSVYTEMNNRSILKVPALARGDGRCRYLNDLYVYLSMTFMHRGQEVIER
jgi:hypothetical protein